MSASGCVPPEGKTPWYTRPAGGTATVIPPSGPGPPSGGTPASGGAPASGGGPASDPPLPGRPASAPASAGAPLSVPPSTLPPLLPAPQASATPSAHTHPQVSPPPVRLVDKWPPRG